MTFTLVSHLREQLSQLVVSKIEEENRREREKERLLLEVCCTLSIAPLDSNLMISRLRRRKPAAPQ